MFHTYIYIHATTGFSPAASVHSRKPHYSTAGWVVCVPGEYRMVFRALGKGSSCCFGRPARCWSWQRRRFTLVGLWPFIHFILFMLMETLFFSSFTVTRNLLSVSLYVLALHTSTHTCIYSHIHTSHQTHNMYANAYI